MKTLEQIRLALINALTQGEKVTSHDLINRFTREYRREDSLEHGKRSWMMDPRRQMHAEFAARLNRAPYNGLVRKVGRMVSRNQRGGLSRVVVWERI